MPIASILPVRAAASRRPACATFLALVLWAATGALVTSGYASDTGGAAPAVPAVGVLDRYAGRPLAAALEELRASGLNLIFSSDLVRPDMKVATEPPDGPPRQVLDVLLAPFGLAARDGPGGTILIVVGSRPRPPRDPAPPLRERVRVDAPLDEGPVRVITPDEDGFTPAGAGGDAARAIDQLPGVVSADATARFGIRGGAANDALILLDGLEIDEPYHLQDFFAPSSLLDAHAMGRTAVMTGVVSAQYGDRTGGVVDLSSLTAAGPGRTSLGVSSLNTSVLSSGGLGPGAGPGGAGPGQDGNWLVSARAWRPDAVVDTVSVQGDGLNPAFSDLFAKLELPLAGGSVLAAHLLAARDDLHFGPDLGSDQVTADDDHRYAWLTWKTPWTTRLYSETVLSSSRSARGRTGSATDESERAIQVDDDRSWGSFGLKQDWMFEAGAGALIRWGFDARRVEAQYAYHSHVGGSVAFDEDLTLEPQGSESGVYVTGRFRPLAPLTLEVGVRRDRQSLTGESETSPRLNLAWDAGAGGVLRAGWGVFQQPQRIDELAIEDGVTGFSPAERAVQWDLGLDRGFGPGMSMSVSAYRRTMDRVTPYYENMFDPFQLFPEAEPDRVRVDPAASLAQGLEMTLAQTRGRAFAWRASYVLAWSEDRIDGAWVPRSWDQRHTFDVSMTWRAGDRWDFDLAGVYHTGWPATGVTAVQEPGPGGTPVIQPVLGPRNAERYPPYHRLDVGVTRRYDLGHGTLGLRFQVMNAYGRENVCCVTDLRYDPQPDGSVRVDRVEGHWLRQVPYLGVTFDF